MKKPRIKHEHNPVRLSGNHIRIGTIQYGVGAEIEDDNEGSLWCLLQLMDGDRTRQQIVQEYVKIKTDFDEESVENVIDELIENGYVEDVENECPKNLHLEELERYSRSTSFFSWIDTKPRISPYEIQERLNQASVTILGLGGTGSIVATALTAAGIGSIHCVDFDKVEISNLNRQTLYTEDDLGRSKVSATLDRLRRSNSHINITGQEMWVDSVDTIAALMQGCDLFILCADKPDEKIQNWTNAAALAGKTPWLMALYAGPMTVVGLFLPWETPCYRCLKHQELEQRKDVVLESLYQGPHPNPVISSSVGLTGSLAAMEAIYFLGDLQPQTIGRIFHQNMMRYDHCYYIDWPFWDECPACGPRYAIAPS